MTMTLQEMNEILKWMHLDAPIHQVEQAIEIYLKAGEIIKAAQDFIHADRDGVDFTIYLEAGEIIKACEQVSAEAKIVMGENMVALESYRVDTSDGIVLVSKPSFRVSYDHQKLDALCEANLFFHDALAPNRSVKEVPGTLVVRAPGGNGKESED